MSAANVNDRESIARIYPRDAFKRDAGRNSVAKASVLYGVRIMSQPDEGGRFELTATKRQVGERDPEGDTAFLPPFLVSDAAALQQGGNAYSGPEEAGDAVDKTEEKDLDYAAFVDRIIETARRIHFKSPDGQDPRLKGFHGG